MEDEIEFREIKELPLNNFFKNEAHDFTPWLEENIELLGNTIGIDIEGVETEVAIGNYRLDILAYESGTDRKIAIENQYGQTNHMHLGQLITYMAGINAEVVVWIAEKFNTEHITAINHLNQISTEDIAFFCIKPRIIKIDDSAPAIEFVIITKPDEWEKQVKSETKISDRGIEYRKFWNALINKYKEKFPKYNFGGGITNRSYITMSYGGTGIRYTPRFSTGDFSITLWLDPPKPDPHILLDKINDKKSFIEGELGAEIELDKKENVRSTKVNLYRKMGADILTMSDKEKEDLIDWIIEWMPKFKKVLNPIVKEIQSEYSVI